MPTEGDTDQRKHQTRVTFFHRACDELHLRQGVDADQVGLHLLAGFLSRFPVRLLRIQLVAASLEGLPAHVALILLIVGPRVCGGHKRSTLAELYKRPSPENQPLTDQS